MADCFRGQANITIFYIYLNIMVENQPIVFLNQKFISFLDTKIVSQKIVMMTTYQFYLCSSEYKQQILIVKNFLNFFIAILKALMLWFLAFKINLLQLLQPELYATNIGFIKFFIGQLGFKTVLKTLELGQYISLINKKLVLW